MTFRQHSAPAPAAQEGAPFGGPGPARGARGHTPGRPLAIALLGLVLGAAVSLPALAATYVVNYFEDEVDVNPGDGICDVDSDPVERCSLRAAVAEAVAFAGFDRIELPQPPPGESYSLDLLSALGGGTVGLSRDMLIVGLGPEPVEVTGGGEASFSIFRFENNQGVPVIENLRLLCASGTLLSRGIDAESPGEVRDSIVTGCHRGITAQNGGDVLLDRVVVEDNDLGVLNEDSTIHIRDSVIRNNLGGVNAFGAGVFGTGAQGLLTIERTLITGNAARDGGGIGLENLGRAAVVNSTVSGNRATFDGAGIHLRFGAELEIASSTVAFNEADSNDDGLGDGGGIWVSGDSEVTLRNSVFSHNTAAGPLVSAWDCFAPANAMFWEGHNLVHHTLACGGAFGAPTNIVAQSASLAPLAPNGGPTLTHAFAGTGPALDAGNPAGCSFDGDFDVGTPLVPLATDQRGASRHIDGDENGSVICDIGAFEAGPPGIFEDGFESGNLSAWSTAVGDS